LSRSDSGRCETSASGANSNPMRAQSEHPEFFVALIADARFAAAERGERHQFRCSIDAVAQALRLMWVSRPFLALTFYRLKARSQALGIPVVPRLAHRWAMASGQLCIGDPVVMDPGVYIPHGQVVIDGPVRVHSGVAISPRVTVGLRGGVFKGARIERDVLIGAGAKVIGPVQIGTGAHIGPNTVVIDDVPTGATAIGIPARVSRGR
jgi:serine O-acetyltransferase